MKEQKRPTKLGNDCQFCSGEEEAVSSCKVSVHQNKCGYIKYWRGLNGLPEDEPMPPKIIAWVSRHPVLPAQVKTLAEKLGDIRVVQVTNTYQNYHDVISAVKALKASHAVIVLPMGMIALMLDSKEAQGIVWLRAEMQPAHEGRCSETCCKEVTSDRNTSVLETRHECSMFDPETDVLMPCQDFARHVRFLEFQVLKSIELITEPFTGGKDNVR